MQSRIGDIKKIINYTCIMAFIMFLFTPLIFQIFSLDTRFKVNEKRTLASFPRIPRSIKDINTFSLKFENYYNDRFGLRNILLKLNQKSRSRIFHISTSSRVIQGKDEWLFYYETFPDYKRENPLTQKELNQWKVILEERQNWLASQGIDYYFVIAPNKNTIYPEYMPDNIVRLDNTSRADQLVDYLNNKSTVKVFYFKDVLLDSKSQGKLYFSNDTHWSDQGALIASVNLSKRISMDHKNVNPLQLNDFGFSNYQKESGDLAIMLGNPSSRHEIVPGVMWKQPQTVKLNNEYVHDGHSFSTYTSKNTNALTALVYYDSFMVQMKPFLSEIFYTTNYEQASLGFSKELILKTKPNILIQETVERNLSVSRLVNYDDLPKN